MAEVILASQTEMTVVQGTTVEVIETPSEDTIVQVATVGPQGAAGGAIGFEQAFTSQSSVTVNHNLGRKPSVTVIDSAGDECIGDVDHLSNNSLVVTFSAAFTGTVLCN